MPLASPYATTMSVVLVFTRGGGYQETTGAAGRARFSCTSNGGRDTRLVVRGGVVVDAGPLLLRELGDRGVEPRPQHVLKSLVQARDLLLRGR